MNRKIFQIASAYMSVIVGGGFASGQEVLQFFTNFGWMGVADRKSTRLNSSHLKLSRMPSSA